MKRVFLFLFFLLFSPLVMGENTVGIDQARLIERTREWNNNYSGFILPEDLIEIEESAFEGTAPVIIKMSEGILQIGNGAFSNINTLKAIYIPESIQYIGNNAIDRHVVLVGAEDSIVHKWAKENNRHFTSYPSLKENKQIVYAVQNDNRKSKISKLLITRKVDTTIKQSSGLTIGELKFIRITQNTDFRIDGRAPPFFFVVEKTKNT